MKLRPACAAILLFGGLSSLPAFASPTAEEIINSVKAHSAEANTVKNGFSYQRVSRVDYLDENGLVKKNTVRVYEVTPVSGQPVSKLILVDGKPATHRDEGHRSAARDTGDKSRSLMLGDDVLARYEYKLMGEEMLGERKTWMLQFSPKAGAPEEGFMDKLLNSMHGTLWVDEQDYEMAKVESHLGRKVSFFGGLAGAIEKLDLQLVQKRVAGSAWLTEALTLDFSGRKLLSPVRLHCLENCSGFQKVVAPLAGK